MRMSGTKPMKNTMRKKSPLKFANLGATLSSAAKGASAAVAAKKAAAKSTGSATVKSGLRGLAGKAKEKVAEKQALKAKQPTQTTKSTPPVEGKPSGPKPSKTISKAPTDAKSAAVKPTASKGAPAAASGGVFQLRKHKR